MEKITVQEKLQIQLAVSELVALADSGMEMGPFLAQFLRKSVQLTGGVGGSLWVLRGERLENVLQDGVAKDLNGQIGDEIKGIPERVMAEQKPCVASLNNHDEYDSSGNHRYIATYVALEANDEPLGILQVIKNTDEEQVVYEEEVQVLQNLARVVSLYVTNVRLPRVVGRFGDLSRLFSADREIFSSLDPTEIAYKLANVIPELVPTERCTVALIEGQRLVIKAISGQDTLDQRSVVVKRLTRVLTHALEAGEPLYISGTQDEETFGKVPALRNEVAAYFQANPFKSLYTVPIVAGDQSVGIVCLESTKEQPFLENDRALIDLFCQQGASALRNARLYHSVPLRAPYEKWLAAREWFARTPRLKVGTYFFAVFLAISIPFAVSTPVKISGDFEVVPVNRTFARSKTDGVLKEFAVTEGDHVVDEQVVALLDDEEPQKRLREALSQAEVLRANAIKYQGLGQIAEYEVEKARLRAIEVEVELLRDALNKTRVLAEGDGVVLTPRPRMVERIGKPVSRGEELVEVGDLGRLVLQASVPEEDISWVKPDGSIRFVLNSLPERTMETKVRLIHAKAEAKEKGNFFLVDADLAAIKGVEFKPGMKGSAKIYGDERSLAYVFLRRLINFVRIHVLF